MEMYLKSYGIDYQLGLDSIEVDETLEKMDLIHQGDFFRVCRLFEKSFYGEIELEEFELKYHYSFYCFIVSKSKGIKMV